MKSLQIFVHLADFTGLPKKTSFLTMNWLYNKQTAFFVHVPHLASGQSPGNNMEHSQPPGRRESWCGDENTVKSVPTGFNIFGKKFSLEISHLLLSPVGRHFLKQWEKILYDMKNKEESEERKYGNQQRCNKTFTFFCERLLIGITNGIHTHDQVRPPLFPPDFHQGYISYQF